MLKLLSPWLAWRAVRLVATVLVIVGVLALFTHRLHAGARYDNAPVTQLRHVIHPAERQLERTIKRVVEP
jgi:hypothetical protein